MKMEAEAKGIYEILSKQADGFDKIVEAAGEDAKSAVMLMITDKLPELVKTQVEAIKNLKIDKITVWDNMSSGADGKSPTSANFLSGMLGSIPPFEELFKMAGLELPDYLIGKKEKELSDQISDIDPTEDMVEDADVEDSEE